MAALIETVNAAETTNLNNALAYQAAYVAPTRRASRAARPQRRARQRLLPSARGLADVSVPRVALASPSVAQVGAAQIGRTTCARGGALLPSRVSDAVLDAQRSTPPKPCCVASIQRHAGEGQHAAQKISRLAWLAKVPTNKRNPAATRTFAHFVNVFCSDYDVAPKHSDSMRRQALLSSSPLVAHRRPTLRARARVRSDTESMRWSSRT